MKKGDAVIVHDENPRMTWKLAVIEDLITGKDGLTQAAMIRTANGATSRPISKLYPLELISEQGNSVEDNSENSGIPDSDLVSDKRHSSRTAARRATGKMKKWARILVAPPEDVVTTEL